MLGFTLLLRLAMAYTPSRLVCCDLAVVFCSGVPRRPKAPLVSPPLGAAYGAALGTCNLRGENPPFHAPRRLKALLASPSLGAALGGLRRRLGFALAGSRVAGEVAAEVAGARSLGRPQRRRRRQTR